MQPSAPHASGSAKYRTIAGAELRKAAPNAMPLRIETSSSRHDLAEHGEAHRPLAADDEVRDHGDDERDRGTISAQHDAGGDLRAHHAHPLRDERERDQRRALRPLGAHEQDADDRQQDARGRIASANMSRKTSSSVSREDAEQHDDGEREHGDDQLQPEAGAGVDHLAQLDER